MKKSVSFENSKNVHPPLGLHSHSVLVPEGTELIFVSGQVGVKPDGSLPDSLYDQADQAFQNILEILEDRGLSYKSIIKLNTYIVSDDPNGDVKAARIKNLGDHRPASTAVWVKRLVNPDWMVELEAIAANVNISTQPEN